MKNKELRYSLLIRLDSFTALRFVQNNNSESVIPSDAKESKTVKS